MKTSLLPLLGVALSLSCQADAAPTKKPVSQPAKTQAAPIKPTKIGTVDLSAVDITTSEKRHDFIAQAKIAAEKQGAVMVIDEASLIWLGPSQQYAVVDLMPSLADYVAKNAKPALSPTQKEAVKAALRLLKRMGSVTRMGVTKTNYTERVGTLQADIDEQLAEIPEGEVKKFLKLATKAYADADTWWELTLRFDLAGALMNNAEVKGLVKEYDMKVDEPAPNEETYGLADGAKFVKAPLERIWSLASTYTASAQFFSEESPKPAK